MAEINEYEALLNQNLESEKSQLKGNFFANEDVQPDRRAEALKIAEKMKVPVDFAEKNLEEFKKRMSRYAEEVFKEMSWLNPERTIVINLGDSLNGILNQANRIESDCGLIESCFPATSDSFIFFPHKSQLTS